MRSYKVTTPAATNILTLAEAKEHLRVDSTDSDTYITALIKAAQGSAEEYTNRFFITTQLKQYGDTWDDICTLFKSPVKTITSIKYYDSDNVLQTLDTSVYQWDQALMPTRVSLQPNQSFPSLANRNDAVEVTYEVGVDDPANVPQAIKQAVLLIIGHLYENREDVVVGRQVNKLPMASKYLLDQYRIFTI